MATRDDVRPASERRDPLAAPPPTVELDEAAALTERVFGIAGTPSRLHSERDANVRIDGDAGSFVLKVYNAAESESVVEMQALAMRHVATSGAGVEVPHVVPPSGSDELYALADLEGRRHAVQLVTFCDGRIAGPDEFDVPALRAFGGAVARVGLALRSFFHPAASRELLWDAKHAPRLRPLLAEVGDAGRAAAAAAALDRFEDGALPALASLRWQTIHNDLTYDNVLVGADRRPVAAIDFGDLTHSPLLFDLAVAVAPFLSGPSLWDRLEALVRGYGEVSPLEEVEAELLADAVSARLAASVLISAWRVRRFPENTDYITAFDDDTWPVLELFAGLGADEVRRRFRRAAAPGVRLGFGPGRAPTPAADELLERRRRAFGPAMLAPTYDRPLHLVRGEGVWLEAADGRRYLDAYNNVPVVGHSHSRVVEAIARQARLLNTNARYLHEAAIELAERLTATLPPALDTCLFVNSGSEANDLAWRFASAVTGAGGGVVSDWAYHGMTATQTDLSPSEWRGEWPDWVATVPPPGTDGAVAGRNALDRLAENGLAPAAFLLDSAWTSDGVFTDTPGYSADAIAEIRRAGGLFIADEVQAGFGRFGTHLWSFESSGVEPDLVTFGKPMGNGHPVAAVATTSEIAEHFAEVRTPVFSTFGGNPVACAAALAVLDVIEGEGLLERVAEGGGYLRRLLHEVASRYASVTNVRGQGLLYGVEVASPELARRVLNGMRDRGVLIGLTGRRENVLKIRPPLVFERAHADRLADVLDETLAAR